MKGVRHGDVDSDVEALVIAAQQDVCRTLATVGQHGHLKATLNARGLSNAGHNVPESKVAGLSAHDRTADQVVPVYISLEAAGGADGRIAGGKHGAPSHRRTSCWKSRSEKWNPRVEHGGTGSQADA